MKIINSLGIRIWLLIAALLLVAASTICGLYYAWNRIDTLSPQLTDAKLQRFQLASDVRRELQNLNDSVLRYELLRDPQLWSSFERASKDVDKWIDKTDPQLNPSSPLTTEDEKLIFGQINRAYDDYVAAAKSLYSNNQPVLVTQAQREKLYAFQDQAERMRELIRNLSYAHRRAQAEFLAAATNSLATIRSILIAGVALLVTLAGIIGWVIYRDAIAPLRLRLVSAESIIERQEKLATLGTLAAGIAHEIRNPLTSIKARLYTLEKHLQSVPPARKDTDIISAEISRLERIVTNVLSFARPSDPELETVGAETMLEEVRALMAPDLEKRGVSLEVNPEPDLLVRADSSRLKQVLINLVRNGAEAIAGAGTVVLRTRAARVAIHGRETEAVIFEVADNGRGIEPDVEKRLFDPFFTTKETGTGLGLAIAARIIEKHGGMLQYQTRPGQGTSFGVVLPREIKDGVGVAHSSKNSAH